MAASVVRWSLVGFLWLVRKFQVIQGPVPFAFLLVSWVELRKSPKIKGICTHSAEWLPASVYQIKSVGLSEMGEGLLGQLLLKEQKKCLRLGCLGGSVS